MLRPGIATWWKHAWLYGGKSKTKSRFVFRICQKPSLCLQSGLTKYTFSNNPGSGKCPFGNSSSRVLFSTSKIRNSTACGHPRCFLQIWDFAVWPWSTAPTCCPSTYLAACLCFTVKDMCWDALTHDSSWDQSSQLFLSRSTLALRHVKCCMSLRRCWGSKIWTSFDLTEVTRRWPLHGAQADATPQRRHEARDGQRRWVAKGASQPRWW